MIDRRKLDAAIAREVDEAVVATAEALRDHARECHGGGRMTVVESASGWRSRAATDSASSSASGSR